MALSLNSIKKIGGYIRNRNLREYGEDFENGFENQNRKPERGLVLSVGEIGLITEDRR